MSNNLHVPSEPPRKRSNSVFEDESTDIALEEDSWEKTREEKRREKLKQRNADKQHSDNNVIKTAANNNRKKPMIVGTGRTKGSTKLVHLLLWESRPF